MMQITTDRAELVSAVTWAAKGIAKRVHVPTLAGMRIEVSGSSLELAGFDYDMTCTAHVAGSDASDGTVLVNGAQLLTAVKALPKVKGARVTLDADDTALTVWCDGDGITSRLALLDISEYPPLPEVPPIAGVADARTLADAVGRVALAAGRDDTLPSLTCVQLRFTGSGLELAATDRYRAHVESIEGGQCSAFDDTAPDALIPARPLAMAFKEMAKHGTISLHVSEHHGDERDGWMSGFSALVTETRTLIVATCNPEQFPRVANLWPSAVTDTVTVDGPALAVAVKRAGAHLDRNGPVILECGPDRIAVAAVYDGSEAYRESVLAAGVPGDVLTIRFNPKYIADALTAAGETATLGLTEPHPVDGLTASAPKRWSFKPITVTADSGTFRALVMAFNSLQDAVAYRRPVESSEPIAA